MTQNTCWNRACNRCIWPAIAPGYLQGSSLALQRTQFCTVAEAIPFSSLLRVSFHLIEAEVTFYFLFVFVFFVNISQFDISGVNYCSVTRRRACCRSVPDAAGIGPTSGAAARRSSSPESQRYHVLQE